MQFFRILIILFIFSISSHVFADEAKNWLKTEIDKIIYAYQNNDLPSENRFLMIEQTINNNFAGSGIAKFVAGKVGTEHQKIQKSNMLNYLKDIWH